MLTRSTQKLRSLINPSHLTTIIQLPVFIVFNSSTRGFQEASGCYINMDDFNSLPPAAQEKILNGPAMTPPDGVVSNFDNPIEHNRAARIVLSVCLAISSIFFLIRFYGTWFVMKKPRLSDCESQSTAFVIDLEKNRY